MCHREIGISGEGRFGSLAEYHDLVENRIANRWIRVERRAAPSDLVRDRIRGASHVPKPFQRDTPPVKH